MSKAELIEALKPFKSSSGHMRKSLIPRLEAEASFLEKKRLSEVTTALLNLEIAITRYARET